MDCSFYQKNFNSFIKGTLKRRELRKLYYHVIKCKKCEEVLLDEFSFYTAFNDLDKDLDFNYKKKLNELLNKVGNDIETSDAALKTKYLVLSLIICFGLFLLVCIAVKVVF